MANARVVLNLKGINEVLREAQPLVDDAAGRVKAMAGPEYEVESNPHRWTGRAFVQPSSMRGVRDNAKRNTLARAFGSVVKG